MTMRSGVERLIAAMNLCSCVVRCARQPGDRTEAGPGQARVRRTRLAMPLSRASAVAGSDRLVATPVGRWRSRVIGREGPTAAPVGVHGDDGALAGDRQPRAVRPGSL